MFRVLPGTSLEDVGFLQRNYFATQIHRVRVEVRGDGDGGIVIPFDEREEYLGGDADALDVETAIQVAFFVGGRLYIRDGTVHCYAANAVRA